ncbi:hypothetical protein HANVADRAFT_51170 [Hanseniaspora valbyensis NRRL Y-1626]|uniref:Brl1/Brr6 domain-containing protein n=1 Tax=Hanseniaspora valbyensis NRRL Y-1626 TaxID=766949 RepID=A0A1B7TIX3_9ASCO|nr:hypothetical protein HANVADRAFT_51170 [Hanseniaspora valbyensis NRRL Y-1626]
MLKFIITIVIASTLFLLLYKEVFKKDLKSRFEEDIVKSRIKYNNCLKQYKESYCGIYDIPYLESYCNELLLCINTNDARSSTNTNNLTTRLQLLIKYFIIDNFDLFLNHYIYMNNDNNNQNMIYNTIFIIIIFLLCLLLPMQLILRKIYPNKVKEKSIEPNHKKQSNIDVSPTDTLKINDD